MTDSIWKSPATLLWLPEGQQPSVKDFDLKNAEIGAPYGSPEQWPIFEEAIEGILFDIDQSPQCVVGQKLWVLLQDEILEQEQVRREIASRKV